MKDDAPAHRFPAFTLAFVTMNIAVFSIFNLAFWDDPRALADFYETYGTVPYDVVNHQDYTRLLTSMFMHGGIMHLGFNMLFLWIYGDNVEYAFGHVGFALFYLVCGVAADVAQIASVPESRIPGIGASGAIAGVMGGFLVLFPRASIQVFSPNLWFMGRFSLPAWMVLGLWSGLQIWAAAVTFGVDGGGVAFAAHAGGFLAGLVLTMPLRLIRGNPDTWPKYEDPLYGIEDAPTVDLRALRKRRQRRP